MKKYIFSIYRMTRSKAKAYLIIVVVALSSTVIGLSAGFIHAQSRAVLYYPRLGVPACTSASDGTNSLDNLDTGFTVVVGTDPQEFNVPNDWTTKNNWEIALSYAILDNSTLINTEIVTINRISNPYTSRGLADTSQLTKNAVEISVSITSQIEPVLYDLYIGYKTSLNLDSLGGYITAEEGGFLGNYGSAVSGDGFILKESNAVYIPSVNDSAPSATLGSVAETISKDPWSLIQITDVHTATGGSGSWANFLKMDNLAQALSIWAPDVIIGTGDITNSPDDYPIEYRRAYNYFKTLGLPVLLDNGNHDQGNLGLWPYYFGPIHSCVNWMDAYFVHFDSSTIMTSQSSSWIIDKIERFAQDHPLFVCGHIPLYDVRGRQMAGYAGSIIDAMIENSGTAMLHGHNHYDMVMDANVSLELYLDAVKHTKTALEMEIFTGACHIPSRVGNTAPSGDGTKIIITTSAAKGERGYNLHEYDIWPDYEGSIGYRRITLAENKMINYTYDKNDDGFRDPSYSIPLWCLNGSLEFNPSSPTQGANFTIANGLTEPIPSARIVYVLPKVGGQTWVPTSAMSAYSFYERNRISNGTHTFIEYRVFVEERISELIPYELTFELELV